MTDKTVVVRYRWDTTDPNNTGWYAENYDEDDNLVDDSVKVWYPVDLEELRESREEEVQAELHRAFPRARIIRDGGALSGC